MPPCSTQLSGVKLFLHLRVCYALNNQLQPISSPSLMLQLLWQRMYPYLAVPKVILQSVTPVTETDLAQIISKRNM